MKTIANLSATLSFMLGSISWTQHIDLLIKTGTAFASIITAAFACRYYYLAAKEKQKNLK